MPLVEGRVAGRDRSPQVMLPPLDLGAIVSVAFHRRVMVRRAMVKTMQSERRRSLIQGQRVPTREGVMRRPSTSAGAGSTRFAQSYNDYDGPASPTT